MNVLLIHGPVIATLAGQAPSGADIRSVALENRRPAPQGHPHKVIRNPRSTFGPIHAHGSGTESLLILRESVTFVTEQPCNGK